MCVECGMPLEVSQSPVAQQERAFIRREIAAGKTKEQIKADLVDEYGRAVLAEPSGGGIGIAAWWVPVILVPLAALVALFTARRWRRRGAASPASAAGFISFISPCVLPLVPGYLSAVSGISLAEIQGGERRTSRVLLPAVVFCLAFTVVFVALG